MGHPAIELTADETAEVYETLNSVGQFIKRFEQAISALDLAGKPEEYSPLASRVMATQRMVGDKIADAQRPGG
jgi:hypothetical protein